jgi:hypothetical protein
MGSGGSQLYCVSVLTLPGLALKLGRSGRRWRKLQSNFCIFSIFSISSIFQQFFTRCFSSFSMFQENFLLSSFFGRRWSSFLVVFPKSFGSQHDLEGTFKRLKLLETAARRARLWRTSSRPSSESVTVLAGPGHGHGLAVTSGRCWVPRPGAPARSRRVEP